MCYNCGQIISYLHATLVLFDGGHDIVYNAGFEWLARQNR